MEILKHKVMKTGYGYSPYEPIQLERRGDTYDFLYNLCLDGLPNTRSMVDSVRSLECCSLPHRRFVVQYEVDFLQWINENQRALLTYTLYIEILNRNDLTHRKKFEEPDLTRFIGKVPDGLRMRYFTIQKLN